MKRQSGMRWRQLIVIVGCLAVGWTLVSGPGTRVGAITCPAPDGTSVECGDVPGCEYVSIAFECEWMSPCGWACTLNSVPTPVPTSTPEPPPTPADAYTVHVAPSTGCTVYAKDGGIDVVETPNGIVCVGGMATSDPLCTEQFKNFNFTMLKVTTDPGYAFTGWTVNGEPAKQAAGPLFLTIRPGLASRGNLLPPGTTEMNVAIGCPVQPTVEIVSADVTQNQIQVRLGPAGAAGTLTLELRDPDTYMIVNAQPRNGSADIQHETFGLDTWNDAAIGRYERIRATWTVGALHAQDEFAFANGMRLDVLGGYTHSQYQAITEEDFHGEATAACLVTDNQCTYQQITLRSDFLSQVIYNTGHGLSIEHGRIQWGGWCANHGYPPPAACAPAGERVRTFGIVDAYQGACGPLVLPGTTVAVGLNEITLAPENPDNLRCGERIFIYQPNYPELQVIKTVTDRCPGCIGARHVDNYVAEDVDAFTYPGSPMTIRLY